MNSRDDRERVAEVVRQAFRDVTLGDGIGLRQAEGLDSYENAARLAALRSEDEKLDWQRIPASDLNIYCNSLPYLDAEGMRFLLPAYLLAELNDSLHIEFVFHLTFFGFGAMSRFRLLDAAQKCAVRAFLELRLRETNCDAPDDAMIKAALETFWAAQP